MGAMKEAAQYQTDADALDWGIILRRCRHAIAGHIPLIFASCIVSLLLLVLYMRIFPPIYVAEAILQGEPTEDVVRSNYYSAWNLFRKGDLKSEPELITSGRVVREVVSSLDLKFNDVHHSFLTQVAYLWTESWVGRNYRAFKEWLWPPDPAAYKATPEEIEKARTVDAFREGVLVESVPGTTIGRVIVKAPTYRAAEFANKVVEVYLAERGKMFQNEADMAYKSLQAEVWRASADLVDLDRQKFDFETRNKVVLDFEKDKLQVGTWAALKTSINDMNASIASIEASLKVVTAQLAAEPREVVQARTLQDSSVKGMLQNRLFQLSTNLQQDRERFVPDSPEVAQLEKFVAETRGALQQESDKVEVGQQKILNPTFTELQQKQNGLLAQLASAKAMLAAKQAPLAVLEKRMDQIPSLVKSMIEQGRNREGLELRYKLLRDRMMQADVSRTTLGSALASVRVIDFANPPMKASWPKNIILFPAALALGLFVGFGLALWAEMFSSRVNRDRLASRADIPVYALVDLRRESHPGLPGMIPQYSQSALNRLRRVS